MKYIKTYESELENIEKWQFAKLAVLKFTRKISELFKEIFHYNLKFVEMISISINLNRQIEIYFGFVIGEFKDFLRFIFNCEYDRKSLSVDELNKLSDEIKDE